MVEINIRNAAVTIGTTPLKIAEPLILGQRQALSLVNTSTAGQIITLQWGQQADVALAGIVLYPAGSWGESLDGAFIPSNLDVWAVSSAAGGTLAIQERIQTGR